MPVINTFALLPIQMPNGCVGKPIKGVPAKY